MTKKSASSPFAPITIPDELTPPMPRVITSNSPVSEHDDLDAEQILHMSAMVAIGWNNIRSIKDISTMTKTTIQLSQHRRKCFQKPYGVTNSKSNLPDVVLPID